MEKAATERGGCQIDWYVEKGYNITPKLVLVIVISRGAEVLNHVSVK